MNLKKSLITGTLTASLLAMPLLAGCGGDVSNESAQQEEEAATTTQMTASDTKTETPTTDTTDTTSAASVEESTDEGTTTGTKVEATLPDALGFAKITSVDGMLITAEFGEVTVPATGDGSLDFAADGTTVDFDVQYIMVYGPTGEQIPYDENTVAVGDIVELGGQGEGDELIVNSMELVDPAAAAANATGTDGTDAAAEEATEATPEESAEQATA